MPVDVAVYPISPAPTTFMLRVRVRNLPTMAHDRTGVAALGPLLAPLNLLRRRTLMENDMDGLKTLARTLASLADARVPRQ
jgi:hypothetical protein